MIPLLLTGTFVCVFPLMLYCLFLAGLNNRPRPTLVAGSWDFAMVVLATRIWAEPRAGAHGAQSPRLS